MYENVDIKNNRVKKANTKKIYKEEGSPTSQLSHTTSTKARTVVQSQKKAINSLHANDSLRNQKEKIITNSHKKHVVDTDLNGIVPENKIIKETGSLDYDKTKTNTGSEKHKVKNRVKEIQHDAKNTNKINNIDHNSKKTKTNIHDKKQHNKSDIKVQYIKLNTDSCKEGDSLKHHKRSTSKSRKGKNEIDKQDSHSKRREYILNYDDKNGTFCSIKKIEHGASKSPDRMKTNSSRKNYMTDNQKHRKPAQKSSRK